MSSASFGPKQSVYGPTVPLKSNNGKKLLEFFYRLNKDDIEMAPRRWWSVMPAELLHVRHDCRVCQTYNVLKLQFQWLAKTRDRRIATY